MPVLLEQDGREKKRPAGGKWALWSLAGVSAAVVIALLAIPPGSAAQLRVGPDTLIVEVSDNEEELQCFLLPVQPWQHVGVSQMPEPPKAGLVFRLGNRLFEVVRQKPMGPF